MPPEVGANYGISAGLDLDRGNVDRLVVKGSLSGGWIRERAETLATVRGDSGWAAGANTTQSGFAHVRYNRQLHGPWRSVTFVQGSANPFKDLLLRNLTGSGIEWRVYPGATMVLGVATTVMAELQVLHPDADDDDGGLHARSSSYAFVGVSLGERETLGASGFVQPRVDRPANWRASSEAFLTIDLSQPASEEGTRPRGNLRLAVGLDFDSEPPQGVAPLDATADILLGVAWR